MHTTPKELARLALYAAVAELADAQDLKSCGTYTPVPVRFRSAALVKDGRNVGFTTFLLFFCFKKVEPLMGCWLMEKHEQGNKFQILEKL